MGSNEEKTRRDRIRKKILAGRSWNPKVVSRIIRETTTMVLAYKRNG